MRGLRIDVLIFVFAFLSSADVCSQPKLKIVFTRFGFLKKYELFQNDVLEYKLKGEHKFFKDRIANLRDNEIIFDQDSVSLDRIKSIRIREKNYHAKLFQKIFLIGGIGYPALNIFNNTMNHYSPLLSEKAAIISGSFLLASFLIYESGIKRIRFTKNKTIKIVNIDFENLNRK